MRVSTYRIDNISMCASMGRYTVLIGDEYYFNHIRYNVQFICVCVFC